MAAVTICSDFGGPPRRVRLLGHKLDSPGFLLDITSQLVKNLRAVWETWVRCLACKGTLEDMGTHSSFLAWRIPMERGAWWATVHGVTKSWTRLNY